MSDMIERVAIAMWDACEGIRWKKRWDELPERVDPLCVDHKRYYRLMAKTAIAAMREPTQPMLDQVCCGHSYSGDEKTITWVWEDMIDAALASPVPPKDAG